jgi:uncharacterized protein YoxC
MTDSTFWILLVPDTPAKLVAKGVLNFKLASAMPTKKCAADQCQCVTDQIKSVADQTKSVTNLIKSATDQIKSMVNLIKFTTNQIKSVSNLIESVTDQTRFVANLIQFATNQIQFATDLIKSVTGFGSEVSIIGKRAGKMSKVWANALLGAGEAG